jgi:integrase/recombinase XerD
VIRSGARSSCSGRNRLGHLVSGCLNLFSLRGSFWERQLRVSGARPVSLAQLQPYLQGKFLDQIEDRLLIDIQDGRQVSNATLKRDLGALSSVLNFSIDRGWRKDNPVLPRLRRIKERRDPIVLPELEDVERLITRAPGLLSKMIQAARVTGARQDELASALRSQLDLPNRRLTLIGKGNKRRVIDLTAFDGYKVFEDLPLGKYLFWHHDGERYKTTASRVGFLHRQLTKRCPEYKRFPFHNLRHLHAVEWLQSGRSIYDLQQRLGHTSLKTTEGYLEFLTPEEKRVSQGVSQKVSQGT